jgi:carbamoyltransferase
MGLQSYGKYNSTLPKIYFFENDKYKLNENLFLKEDSFMINTDLYPMLKSEKENKENLIDFSFHTQKAFEEIGLNLLKKLIDKTNCENLILTGGASLNVVANNFFRKNIPSKINFYIEPICGDEGNSIGAVQNYIIHEQKRTLNKIYLGPKRDYEIQLKTNEKCFDNVSKKYIAELLDESNIVSLFQGSSEAGPRALGNRSIIFDPRVENGKDIVNVVKKREWFRPFACTILLEHSKNWFDMHCLNESPHMMYALDALPGVKEKIPAVIHVDNTCRVQTLTKEQNLHFYELIEEFYKLTDVPLLLNTSFNLAGDPMVETIEDALETLRKSQLEYLYLPKLEKLIYIENKGKHYVKT